MRDVPVVHLLISCRVARSDMVTTFGKVTVKLFVIERYMRLLAVYCATNSRMMEVVRYDI